MTAKPKYTPDPRNWTQEQVAARLGVSPTFFKRNRKKLREAGFPEADVRGQYHPGAADDWMDMHSKIGRYAPAIPTPPLPPLPPIAQEPSRPAWIGALLRDTRQRAKKRGLRFSLEPDHIVSMIERNGAVCEVTGIPFEFEKIVGQFRRPFTPSIDRIDRQRGYVLSNVRLVACAANTAMNEWGLDVLLRVARATVKKHGIGE